MALAEPKYQPFCLFVWTVSVQKFVPVPFFVSNRESVWDFTLGLVGRRKRGEGSPFSMLVVGRRSGMGLGFNVVSWWLVLVSGNCFALYSRGVVAKMFEWALAGTS